MPQGAFPSDIVLGSDGALWFTESRGNAIGRVDVDGKVTEYPIPTPDAFAADITPGPGRRAVVHRVAAPTRSAGSPPPA